MNFSGVVFLSWKFLAYRPLRTLVLVGAVALTIYLPLGLQVFTSESTRLLQERARSTPLLIGPKGSSIDLTLNGIYFTSEALPPLEQRAFTKVSESGLGTVIPLHVRFQARGAPIVGTSLEYFRYRGMKIADGRMLTRLGQCVLGASLARERGLEPGDTIVSSPENVFDLAGVYPLRMAIAGVFEPTHTPDDDAVFVDLKTAWVIEGLAHGHQDVTRPEAADTVLSRDGDTVRANASVVEYNEVTAENIGSFHFHGDPAGFPISSIIAIPDSDKSRAILLGRYQGDAGEQIVVPLEAVMRLTGTLFATRRLILAGFVLLGVGALGLAALVFILSFRIRDREMRAYAKIGATANTIRLLKSAEVVVVLALGVMIAGAAVATTKTLAADLLPMLLG